MRRRAGAAAVVLASLLLAGLWPAAARSATLADFGYDGWGAHGTRPLVTVMIEFADVRFDPDHDAAFYEDLLFGTGGSLANVAGQGGIFDEMSHGEFMFTNAGVFGPYTMVDSPSTGRDESTYACAYGSRTGCGDLGGAYIRAGAISHVNPAVSYAEAPFPFATYDRNGDGCVTQDEVTVLIVVAEPAGTVNRILGNASGIPPSIPVGSGRALCSNTVGIGEAASAATFAHELSHTLGAIDVYGAEGAANYRYTLMGATAIPGEEDDRHGLHLDPYHKLRLGWLQPQLVEIGERRCLSLRPTELNPTDTPQAYILYDPERGANEYFLLEHRLSVPLSYDGDPWLTGSTWLPDQGLAIWYVKTDGADVALRVPAMGTSGEDRALYIVGPGGTGRAGTNGLWERRNGMATPPWLTLDGTTGATPSGAQIAVLSPRVTVDVLRIGLGGITDPADCPVELDPPPLPNLIPSFPEPESGPCKLENGQIVCRIVGPSFTLTRRVPAGIEAGDGAAVEWTLRPTPGAPPTVRVNDRLPDELTPGDPPTAVSFTNVRPGTTQTKRYRLVTGELGGRWRFDTTVTFRSHGRARKLKLRSALITIGSTQPAPDLPAPTDSGFPEGTDEKLPDLTVTAVTETGVTVTNVGEAASGAFATAIVELGQTTIVDSPLGLAAGASVVLPYQCGPGQTVAATADWDAKVDESDELNNLLAAACPAAALPDLIVTDITQNGFTIANVGTAAAGPFAAKYSVQGQEITFQFNGLAAGQSVATIVQCAPQTTVDVVADSGAQVTESNENNNSRSELCA